MVISSTSPFLQANIIILDFTFFKSLNIENKLSEKTIELLKNQKGRTAANIFKQARDRVTSDPIYIHMRKQWRYLENHNYANI